MWVDRIVVIVVIVWEVRNARDVLHGHWGEPALRQPICKVSIHDGQQEEQVMARKGWRIQLLQVGREGVIEDTVSPGRHGVSVYAEEREAPSFFQATGVHDHGSLNVRDGVVTEENGLALLGVRPDDLQEVRHCGL